MRVDDVGAGRETVAPGAYARALADDRFRARYRSAYRGEGDPLDGLWWLEHPEERSPSGRPAPWATARAARRRVYAPGCTAEELAAAVGAERHAAGLRDAARAALAEALDAEPPRPQPLQPAGSRPAPRLPRPLAPLVAVVAVVALLVAAVSALPKPHVDRPGVARSLQAAFPGARPRPADVLLAVSGAGGETVTRSVTGTAPLRITTLLCRGVGRIHVRLSDEDGDGTGMECVGGHARLTRILDAMPAAPFVATIDVVGRVAWAVTVADERPEDDTRTDPPCGGVEC